MKTEPTPLEYCTPSRSAAKATWHRVDTTFATQGHSGGFIKIPGRWAVGKREAQADNAASNQSISELNTHRTRKRELRGGVEKEWRLRLNSKLRPALRTPEVAQRTAAFCVARPLLRIRYLCKEANVVGNAVKK